MSLNGEGFMDKLKNAEGALKKKKNEHTYTEFLFVIDTNIYLHRFSLLRKLFDLHEMKDFTLGRICRGISSCQSLVQTLDKNLDKDPVITFRFPQNADIKNTKSSKFDGLIKVKIGVPIAVRLELDAKKLHQSLKDVANRSIQLLNNHLDSTKFVFQSFQEFDFFNEHKDSKDTSILKFCLNLAQTRHSSKIFLVSDDINFAGLAASSHITVLSSKDLRKLVEPNLAQNNHLKFLEDLDEYAELKSIFIQLSAEVKEQMLKSPKAVLVKLME